MNLGVSFFLATEFQLAEVAAGVFSFEIGRAYKDF